MAKGHVDKDAQGRPSFATGDPTIRAGWHFFLIESDNSFGVQPDWML